MFSNIMNAVPAITRLATSFCRSLPRLIGGFYFGNRLIDCYLQTNPYREKNNIKSLFIPLLPDKELKFANPQLTSKVNQLAKQMGITPEVFVFITPEKIEGIACGYNSLRSNPAVILNADNETKGTITHELAHIKNNDLIRFSVISTLSLLSVIIYRYKRPYLLGKTAEMTTLVACNLLMTKLYMRRRERAADFTSMQYQNKDDLAESVKYFHTHAIQNKKIRNRLINSGILKNLFQSPAITPSGNLLIDIQHPFITTRRDYFKKAYDEREGIVPLKLFVQNNSLEEIPLTENQIKKIRQIIDQSSKQFTLITLEEVTVNITRRFAKVDLLNSKHPVYYSTNIDTLSNPNKIEELFHQIVHTPPSTTWHCKKIQGSKTLDKETMFRNFEEITRERINRELFDRINDPESEKVIIVTEKTD